VLEVGHIINLVRVSMEEPEPDRRRNIKAFVSHQRIDLVYEETLRIFSI
jgi:hypothetical protein